MPPRGRQRVALAAASTAVARRREQPHGRDQRDEARLRSPHLVAWLEAPREEEERDRSRVDNNGNCTGTRTKGKAHMPSPAIPEGN